jgi:cephalosporin hydroxylase
VGVDIEIRPHNRAAVEQHVLSEFITLIEGSSTDEEIVARVSEETRSAQRTLVILDSSHTREHVLAELEAYSHLVNVGSYIIAMDGIMSFLTDTPKGDASWSDDNPISAVDEFVSRHPAFVVEQPPWRFNESELRTNITHSPSGFLRRVS